MTMEPARQLDADICRSDSLIVTCMLSKVAGPVNWRSHVGGAGDFQPMVDPATQAGGSWIGSRHLPSQIIPFVDDKRDEITES